MSILYLQVIDICFLSFFSALYTCVCLIYSTSISYYTIKTIIIHMTTSTFTDFLFFFLFDKDKTEFEDS